MVTWTIGLRISDRPSHLPEFIADHDYLEWIEAEGRWRWIKATGPVWIGPVVFP